MKPIPPLRSQQPIPRETTTAAAALLMVVISSVAAVGSILGFTGLLSASACASESGGDENCVPGSPVSASTIAALALIGPWLFGGFSVLAFWLLGGEVKQRRLSPRVPTGVLAVGAVLSALAVAPIAYYMVLRPYLHG